MSKEKQQKIASFVVKEFDDCDPPPDADIHQRLLHPAHVISQTLEIQLVNTFELD
jgi:hypothetical protein